jgi:predicted DNA-binding transcriptional regulator AlpA
MELEIDRRVYRRELEQLTGWGATWIRELEKRGKIPTGRVDQGGKRKWWPVSEVRAIVAGRQVGAAEKQAA